MTTASKQTDLSEYVTRAQRGDQEAVGKLYELTHDKLYFLALKLLHSKEDALDAVQDAYITVFSKLKTLESVEAFPVWINRIVANRCKDMLKVGGIHVITTAHTEEIFAALEDSDDDVIPHSYLDHAETRNMIMNIIDSLTLEQRSAILLKYYSEFSVKEIAAALEISVDAVKQRLYAARKAIKRAVEAHEQKGGKLYAMGVPALTLLLREISGEYHINPEKSSEIYQNILKSIVLGSGGGILSTLKGWLSKAKRILHFNKVSGIMQAATITQKAVAGIVAAGIITTAVSVPVIAAQVDHNVFVQMGLPFAKSEQANRDLEKLYNGVHSLNTDYQKNTISEAAIRSLQILASGIKANWYPQNVKQSAFKANLQKSWDLISQMDMSKTGLQKSGTVDASFLGLYKEIKALADLIGINTHIAVSEVTSSTGNATLTEGDTSSVTATVHPWNADDSAVTWSTSDASIATVDSTGKITGVKAGTCAISATAMEKSATVSVTVNPKTISVSAISVSENNITIAVGDTQTIKATVSPDNATDKTLTWSSNDPKTATVDGNGKITGVQTGKCIVTVKSNASSDISSSVTVYVKAASNQNTGNHTSNEKSAPSGGSVTSGSSNNSDSEPSIREIVIPKEIYRFLRFSSTGLAIAKEELQNWEDMSPNLSNGSGNVMFSQSDIQGMINTYQTDIQRGGADVGIGGEAEYADGSVSANFQIQVGDLCGGIDSYLPEDVASAKAYVESLNHGSTK